MNDKLIFAGIPLYIQDIMAGKISCGSTFFLGTFVPEDGAGEPGFKISAGSTFLLVVLT